MTKSNFIQIFTNTFQLSFSSDLDTIMGVDPCARGSISKLVNIIFSDNLHIVWSQDISAVIDDETWKEVLNRVNSSFLCTRHRQCKLVHNILKIKVLHDGIKEPFCLIP